MRCGIECINLMIYDEHKALIYISVFVLLCCLRASLLTDKATHRVDMRHTEHTGRSSTPSRHAE
jgi:hypothetical protein